MSDVSITYPITPTGVDEAILQPSSSFKQEVSKVLLAIVFFMLTYLVLMAAAIALAILSASGGFLLVVNFPKIFTLMIGIGLIGLGVMVIFFLLKFLFKRNKVDRSHLIELKESDQPELFAFVRRLTRETQCQFPKKIYISPEVNASVFYDSSFWSMFLPIRKNLQIGLGLVNSVNLSEFKAILAHEFGHFSQRSMKLGSYVYNVNQIIYNMLYDNDSYGRTLDTWANISGYFAFFANITIKIVIGIQWILQKVYSIVNKNYMALSRQMEFHADSVSAYVSGSDHLVTSLRRLEVADSAYNRLFGYYDLWYKQNFKPDNLYPQHNAIMNQFAKEQGIPLEYGLPQVNAHSFANFNKTRLVIKDQWASHPSTEDREAHLNRLNIRTEAVKSSAWVLFREAEMLQKQVTEKIYSGVKFENPPQVLDVHSFRRLYSEEVEKYQINARYKSFFNDRDISPIDLTNIDASHRADFGEILDDQTLSLPRVIDGLKADIQNLELIIQGTIPVKTFEFNGKKYKKVATSELVDQLRQELAAAENQLVTADYNVISFFIKAAERHGQTDRLRDRYRELFQVSASAEEDLKNYAQLINDINPIYYDNLSYTDIRIIMAKIKNNEMLIKDRLRELFQEGSSAARFISDEQRKTVEDYLSKNHEYFNERDFNNEALMLLNQAMSIYQLVVSERRFKLKKDLLEWQLSLLNN
jgi:Zn-dependent protease with chaperone function